MIPAIVNGIWGDNAIWEATGPGIAQLPDDVVATPDFSLLGEFPFGFFSTLGFVTAIVPVFAVMLSDFFDAMTRPSRSVTRRDRSTRRAGCRTSTASLVDSLAAAAGGAASASSNTTFIGSAAGISEGARTGPASVVTGALILLCVFLSRGVLA